MQHSNEAPGQVIRNFILEMQQRNRDERDAIIQDACEAEREDSIALSALAILDAGLSEDVAAQKLQKHWDLRPSEASRYLCWARAEFKKQQTNKIDYGACNVSEGYNGHTTVASSMKA